MNKTIPKASAASTFSVLLLTLLLTIGTIDGSSQSTYDHEIVLQHDNDAFVLYKATDVYYSFGLSVAYRRAVRDADKDRNLFHRIFPNARETVEEYRLFLKGFTPANGLVNSNANILDFDRPFAGWLYGEYRAKSTLGKWRADLGLSAGVLGPSARAGEVQTEFHNLIGVNTYDGWDSQIQDQLGINLLFDFRRSVYRKGIFELIAESESSLGTVFTQTAAGGRMRIGIFKELSKSMLYGSGLNHEKGDVECYLTASGGARLVGYNATIQGGVLSDQLIDPYDLDRMALGYSFGAHLSVGRFSGTFDVVHSKGDVENTFSHNYAAMALACYF